MKIFVDSNIPMYVAGSDHPNKEPSRRLLQRIMAGEVEACTSAEVLQEILHRYVSIGRRDVARDVYDLFASICPVVFPITLADTDRAKDLVSTYSGISSRDALHASVMMNHEVAKIATFDAGFDNIAGIIRVQLD